MAAAEFKTYITTELPIGKLQSMAEGFNEVFGKNLSVAYFEQQALITVKGYSYHSFMEVDGEVVGACTGIPYTYMYNGQKMIFGLPINLFVKKEYRKDPFALYKIYSKLKDMMIKGGLSFAMAVPNEQSYPYFIHALKWKDIGALPYYALPARYGNIKKRNHLFNVASLAFSYTLTTLECFRSFFMNSMEKQLPVCIVRSEPLMENHRYTSDHVKVKMKSYSFFYRFDTEEGIKTVYLIDFYNEAGKKDAKSLNRSVRYILKHVETDIILFVGKLHFTQFSLLKVPSAMEPRKLTFSGEILNKVEVGPDIFEFKNWDFGLYNFDVR